MSRFSHRILFSIIFILISLVLVLIKVLDKPSQLVNAAWFDDNWIYRQSMQITNTGSDLTNYQIGFTMNTSTLISASKLQSNCADLRIVDNTGKLLPHWIEEGSPGCNSTDTKIWTKLDRVPSSSAFIYIYYGNSVARGTEDGEKVFLFFDNFNTPTINTIKWNVVNVGTSTILSQSGGKLTLNATTLNDVAEVHARAPVGTGNEPLEMQTKVNNIGSTGTGIRNRIYMTDTTLAKPNAPADHGFFSAVTGAQPQVYFGTFLGTGITLASELKITQKLDGTNFTYNIYDISNSSNVYTGSTGFTATTYNRPRLASTRDTAVGGTTCSQVFDWVFVRKIASTEPTMSVPTGEELSAGPISYWKFNEGVGTTIYNSTQGSPAGSFGVGNSAPTWQTGSNCIVDDCLSFDGNDYIRFPDTDPINYNFKDISASAWIKTSTDGKSFFQYQNGNPTIQMQFGNTSGGGTSNKFVVYLRTNVGSLGVFSGNKTVVDGTWHHVAFTRSATTQKVNLYVDGELDSSQNYSDVAFINTSTGVNHYLANSNSSYLYNGSLDELKVYKYARTDDQIKAEYNSREVNKGAGVNLGIGLTAIQKQPIVYYKFDNSLTTTTIYNSSSTLYNTTANGGSISRDGKFNNAIQLNGINDFVLLPTNLGTTDTERTVTMWYNSERVSGGPGVGSIDLIQRGDFTTTGFWIEWYQNGDMSLNVPTSSGIVSTAIASTTSINQWNQVSFTIKSTGNITTYFNGVKANQSATISTWTEDNSGGYFSIGTGDQYSTHGINFYNQFLKGKIDEVKIYSQVLTEQEIAIQYNQGNALNLGSLSTDAGATIPSYAGSRQYCVPGDTTSCAPPVAEWLFEEGTGTSAFDTGTSAYHAVLATGSSAPKWTDGYGTKGMYLDGNDYLGIGNTSIYSATQTITAWINPQSFPNGAPIYNRRTAGNVGGSSLELGSSNQIYCHFYISGIWYNALSPVNSLSTNTWQHITCSYDGTKIMLFINGKAVGQTNISGSINNPTNPSTEIGRNIATKNISFVGKIDDVRVYNYARTPAQVAWEYNQGKPVVHFKMDECQGSIIYDSIGTGITGIVDINVSGSQTTTIGYGTCTNSAQSPRYNGVIGKYNSSLKFDGTEDYAIIPHTSSLDLGSTLIPSYTVSSWIKIPDLGTFQIFLDKGDGLNLYPFSFRVNVTPGKGYFSINDGTNITNLNSQSTVTDDKWHHIVGVRNTNTNSIYLYIDGVLEGQATDNSVNSIALSYPIYVGNNISNFAFSGQVDDLKIFNYPLTATQVKTLYNNGTVNFAPTTGTP